MKKQRLSKILARCTRETVHTLADEIRAEHDIVIVKAPEKSLAMIKMREPVKETLFYLGEVIICEAIVSLDGVKGMAALMGDDFDKVLDMAVIDAACSRGVFREEAFLTELEKAQEERRQKENAMFMNTMVNFKSMDSEVQG
ncbi:MAG: phosphonate C-P lyase system protein PhnG [Lachnospiraceae bacterium]|nr:phosphonate C-P lyase system protein PhnG [Lachnospiraceae bacterium]